MNDISVITSRSVEGVSRPYQPIAAGILPPGPTPKSPSTITKATALPPGRKPLTPRQWQILGLVAKGLPDKHIAEHLCISEETVAYHFRVMFRHHKVHSRASLIGMLAHVSPHPN